MSLFASTTQLAAYTIYITTTIFEIYHRVRDAPKKIQEYIRRISQLLGATHLIDSETLLHTEAIGAQVGQTLYQAQELLAVLIKARDSHCFDSVSEVWTVLIGRRDKEIADSFERLEHEKNTLLMSIQIVNTNILGSIQSSVDTIVGRQVSESGKRSSLPVPSYLVRTRSNVCFWGDFFGQARPTISITLRYSSRILLVCSKLHIVPS